MQQRKHTDRQGNDDRKRGQDEDPQDHVDLRLIGGQRVENVELVRARARQLHLGADENSRDHLVGVARADTNRLPLRAPTRDRGAHLRGDERAHLLILDLVDAQRGRGSLRAQQRHVRCTRAGRRGLEGGQRAARGLLNLRGRGCGRRGEHGLRGRKAQGGVSQNRVLARLKHGGTQLGGDDHPKNEEDDECGDRDRQCDACRQGMPDAPGEMRGGK